MGRERLSFSQRGIPFCVQCWQIFKGRKFPIGTPKEDSLTVLPPIPYPTLLCAHTPQGTNHTLHPYVHTPRGYTQYPILLCAQLPEGTHSTLYPCVHTPRGHTQYPASLCIHTPEGTHFPPSSLPTYAISQHPWQKLLLKSLCWQFKSNTFHPKVRLKCIPSFILWDSCTQWLVCFEV